MTGTDAITADIVHQAEIWAANEPQGTFLWRVATAVKALYDAGAAAAARAAELERAAQTPVPAPAAPAQPAEAPAQPAAVPAQ